MSGIPLLHQGHRHALVDRPPQTDLELYWAIKSVWGQSIPWTRVCEHHISPFEAFAEAYFARQSIVLWHASRGFGGKSFLLSILGLSEAAFLGAKVTILGGSSAQSLNVHEHSKDLWYSTNAPIHMMATDPTKWDTHLNNGGHIRSLMASQTSVRGPHPQRLRMDEIDEMELGILEAAQGQPMRKTDIDGQTLIETQTTMSSTWQYPHGCLVEGSPVITNRGEIPIQEVHSGDSVPTRNGWKPVLAKVFNGRSETVIVTTASGKTLRCTPNHPVWTQQGWIEASALTPFSHVCVTGIPIFGSVFSGSVSSTDTTTNLLLFPNDSAISTKQLVTVGADHSGGNSDSPTVIDLVANNFKMRGIDTHLHPAKMINHCPFGDGSIHDCPDPSMSEPYSSRGIESSVCFVPISSDLVRLQRPDDTSVGSEIERVVFETDLIVDVCHSSILLPVWDLSIEGTHEYVGSNLLVHNTFTEIKARAEDKGWPVHSWCMAETSNPHDGWLSQEEVERKRLEIPAAMWEAEYELQEPNPANRIFSQETIEILFNENLGTFVGEGPHRMADKPVRGVHYTTGVDWAKERDYTVVVTFADDGEKMECVEWRRMQKISWTQIAELAAQQWMRWGGVFIHDNTGVGDVVDDVIREKVPRQWRRKIKPFQMTGGKATSNLFTEYISGIEDQYLSYPRIEHAYDNHRFLTMEQVYGRDHVPDDVVAGAMAWHGRLNRERIEIVLPRQEIRVSPNQLV